MQDEFKSAASFLYVSNIEKQVLGASISTPDTLNFVLEHMKPVFFYDKLHIDIMQVLIDITSEGKLPDMLLVVERLRKKKSLGSTGLTYIADMSSSYYVMKSQLSEHCDIIKQYYFRRSLVEINQRYAQIQLEQDGDPVESYDEQQQVMMQLMQEVRSERAASTANVVTMVRQQVANAANGIVPANILSTGLKALDNVIVGLFPTDLILIGARPSMGKTALILSIVMSVCRRGKAVRIYSLEMSSAQLISRLAAMLSGVSFEAVKRANLTREQEAKINAALDEINKWKLYVDDRAGLSFHQIRSSSIQDQSTGKDVELIVVDYIQLMNLGKDSSNRNLGIGTASTGLKNLAKELDIPVVVLSQLNRSLEARPDKRPTLADLRDSGSLEQDADMVLFLYRAEQYGMTHYTDDTSTVGVAEINVAKNRNGELGLAITKFEKEITKFSDLEENALAAYYEEDTDENPF